MGRKHDCKETVDLTHLAKISYCTNFIKAYNHVDTLKGVCKGFWNLNFSTSTANQLLIKRIPYALKKLTNLISDETSEIQERMMRQKLVALRGNPVILP